MIKWNARPTIQKSSDHAVTYFTKQLAAIESFEAAGGGASKKQGYKSTNASTEFQATCVAEIQQNRAATDEENKVMATAFTGAIAEQQAEIKSLREILEKANVTIFRVKIAYATVAVDGTARY